MSNKWRDEDYNRWTEEEIRRSPRASGRYEEPRQFSQDYTGGQQFGAGTNRTDSDWQRRQRQRERLRRAAPDMDSQFQQESFSRPGTFYYGGEPQRSLGLSPTEYAFEGENAPDEYGRDMMRNAAPSMNYNRDYRPTRGFGYGPTFDPARIDAAYREMSAFQQDMQYDPTPERFHPDREQPYHAHQSRGWLQDDPDRGPIDRMRNWLSSRGKGPKGYKRSDDRIREDVSDHLTQDHFVDASHIEIAVTDCECTLTGTVSTRDEKRRAEDIAERVMGVKHVQYNLRVAPPTATSMLSSQDRTGTMSTNIGTNPTLSANRASSGSK